MHIQNSHTKQMKYVTKLSKKKIKIEETHVSHIVLYNIYSYKTINNYNQHFVGGLSNQIIISWISFNKRIINYWQDECFINWVLCFWLHKKSIVHRVIFLLLFFYIIVIIIYIFIFYYYSFIIIYYHLLCKSYDKALIRNVFFLHGK